MRAMLIAVSLLVFSCGSPTGGGNFSSASTVRERGDKIFDDTQRRLTAASNIYADQYQACKFPTPEHPATACKMTPDDLNVYVSGYADANNTMSKVRDWYAEFWKNPTENQLTNIETACKEVNQKLDKLNPKP